MPNNMAVRQADLLELGYEFYALVREVIADDPAAAMTAFGIRRPNIVYLMHRLTRQQIDRVLGVSGMPVVLRQPAHLQLALNVDEPAAHMEADEPRWVAQYDAWRRAYWLLMRDIARICPATAASVMGATGASRDAVRRLPDMTIRQLRVLARQRSLLTLNPAVGYDLVLILADADVSDERLQIAGAAVAAWAAQPSQPLGIGVLA